jgi:hypothetical protein
METAAYNVFLALRPVLLLRRVLLWLVAHICGGWLF